MVYKISIFKRIIFNLKSGLRATKVYFFVSKKKNSEEASTYHLVHEFSDLEEIKENLSEILSNIKILRFISKFEFFCKERFFATIDCLNNGIFFARNINMPLELKVINSDQYLFNKISNRVFMRVLINIDF